jgi:hypothetical protein
MAEFCGTLNIYGHHRNIVGRAATLIWLTIFRKADVNILPSWFCDYNFCTCQEKVSNKQSGYCLFVQKLRHLRLGTIVKGRINAFRLDQFLRSAGQLRSRAYHYYPG